jgi:hypothetical protein
VGRPWTRPADVRETVRKKWPELLQAFAAGQDWTPRDIPLRGPGPAEIGARLGDVQAWAAEWAQAARGPLRVEYKQVGGRLIGTNAVPARAWLDGYDQAWDLLGTRGDVRRFTGLAERTKAEAPRLSLWLERRPVKALELADDWPNLLATVRWIDERQVPGMYLRQVDVPGVDTKFIGKHRGVLTELLDLQLDPRRIDPHEPGFEGRYGFRRKPGYVRFRVAPGTAGGYTELVARADEFTASPPGVKHAYVVENEITYLAFPLAVDAIVIFGGGYAVRVLESLGWLAGLDLVYWGDLDTHGFAILNQLRHCFPHARSMLMDRATLLAHKSQWVTEPSPTTAALDLLTPTEQELYRALGTNMFGPAVRLEQERVSFTALKAACGADPVLLAGEHGVDDDGVVHRRDARPVPRQAEVSPVDPDLAVQPHLAVDAGDSCVEGHRAGHRAAPGDLAEDARQRAEAPCVPGLQHDPGPGRVERPGPGELAVAQQRLQLRRGQLS